MHTWIQVRYVKRTKKYRRFVTWFSFTRTYSLTTGRNQTAKATEWKWQRQWHACHLCSFSSEECTVGHCEEQRRLEQRMISDVRVLGHLSTESTVSTNSLYSAVNSANVQACTQTILMVIWPGELRSAGCPLIFFSSHLHRDRLGDGNNWCRSLTRQMSLLSTNCLSKWWSEHLGR